MEILRELVKERLTTAAEEIFVVFEKTIKVYEEEINRQRELLSDLKPVGIRVKDVLPPQAVISEERVHCQKQEMSPILVLEDSEGPQIKDDQKELWTDQEGPQFQELDEPDIIEFTFNPITVKNEHDTEKPQSLQISQIPSKEDRETSPLPSTSKGQMKTEPEPELWNCETMEADGNVDPTNYFEPINGAQLLEGYSKTFCHNDKSMGNEEYEFSLKTLKSKRPQKSKVQNVFNSKDFRRSNDLPHDLKSSHRFCKVCKKYFPGNFTRHINSHVNDCGVCGKHLEPTETLELHLQVHRTCGVCGKRFSSFPVQERHVKIHTGEKPFVCQFCGKNFVRNDQMQSHLRCHTGEKPYSCTICGKRFRWKAQLTPHLSRHTGEKPNSCNICGKACSSKANLNQHMLIHCGRVSTGSQSRETA